jgi:hypothetical protein
MSKPLKTAAQLLALLNAELGKQDACVGVSVDGITQSPTRGSITPGQPPSFDIRMVACQDNAHASSSQQCACCNSNTIWRPRRFIGTQGLNSLHPKATREQKQLKGIFLGDGGLGGINA